jgi:hypothetical protein
VVYFVQILRHVNQPTGQAKGQAPGYAEMEIAEKFQMKIEIPSSCELRDKFVALSVQTLPICALPARNYTVCDRYFPSVPGPTFPNRLFLPAAQTERKS